MDLTDDQDLDTAESESDTVDNDDVAPEEIPLIVEDPEEKPEEEEIPPEIAHIEEPPAKHKAYGDPEILNHPLRPEELWDEDGTI
jgi:hypothetical protein